MVTNEAEDDAKKQIFEDRANKLLFAVKKVAKALDGEFGDD